MFGWFWKKKVEEKPPTKQVVKKTQTVKTQESPLEQPPYPVILACKQVGVLNPEDVPWVRIGSCHCGATLPELKRWRFTFSGNRQAVFSIGQCKGCRRVYWSHK